MDQTLPFPHPAAGDRSVIDADWFGIIQSGYHGMHGFNRQFLELNGQAIRWPGGTLSETNHSLYDLTNPEVFDAAWLYKYNPSRDRPSLAQMLDYCADNALPFSMVIPTQRYDGVPATGAAEVEAFATRLLAGAYGPLPADVTLEIGNEYFDLAPFAHNPERYGRIASLFTETIAGVVNDPLRNPQGHDIRIAVQAGRTEDDNSAILSQFSGAALREVDELIVHALPVRLENFRHPTVGSAGEETLTRIDRILAYGGDWQAAVADAGGGQTLDLYVSAWTVGSSAASAGAVNMAYQDIGLRAASTMVDMFAGFSVAGVDAMAVWGVHIGNLNSFSHVDSDNTLDITPAGAMFGLMSEALPGTAFLGTWGDEDRDAPVMTNLFAGPGKAVLYLSANNIPETGLTALLHLPEGFDWVIADAVSLGMIHAPGVPIEGHAIDRIFERPVITPLDLAPRDGLLPIPLGQDHEIVQIVFEAPAGRAGDWPGEGDPVLTLLGLPTFAPRPLPGAAPADIDAMADHFDLLDRFLDLLGTGPTATDPGSGIDYLAMLRADEALGHPDYAAQGHDDGPDPFLFDFASLPLGPLLDFDLAVPWI